MALAAMVGNQNSRLTAVTLFEKLLVSENNPLAYTQCDRLPQMMRLMPANTPASRE